MVPRHSGWQSHSQGTDKASLDTDNEGNSPAGGSQGILAEEGTGLDLQRMSQTFPHGGNHGGSISRIERHSNQRKQAAQKASGI